MRFRPGDARFSLLTLLLVTTLVALSITIAMLYRELLPLRQEVARLRNEVGELHVSDATKLHMIRVDTDSELEWKWRIWIPKGASYHLRGYGELIPKEGFPTSGGTIDLREPGEHVIRYSIRRDPKDEQWYGTLQTDDASVGKDLQPWVKWPSHRSNSEGVGKSTRGYTPGERVVLIRHRVSQATSSGGIEDPSAGLMIWLRPN